MKIKTTSQFINIFDLTLNVTVRNKILLVFFGIILALTIYQNVHDLKIMVINIIKYPLVFVTIMAIMIILQSVFVYYGKNNNIYREENEIEIDINGLVYKGITAFGKIEIKAIKKIIKTPNTIIIYISNIQAFLISRKSFGNEVEYNKYYEYIKNIQKQNMKSA